MCCTIWIIGVIIGSIPYHIYDRAEVKYQSSLLSGKALEQFIDSGDTPSVVLVLFGTLPVGLVFLLFASIILSFFYKNPAGKIFVFGDRKLKNIISLMFPTFLTLYTVYGISKNPPVMWFDYIGILSGVFFIVLVIYIYLIFRAALSR